MVERIVWESREHIWATAPPLPGGAEAVLDHYFAGREAEFPTSPAPVWEEVAGVILAGGPSAPGVD
eukprot:8858451-Alexandrium_andersonii.AAC.1